jgi:integrase
MGHIQDRWTTPGPNGRRVKSDRYGQGKRWLVRWEEDGARKAKAFDTKDAAAVHLSKIRVDQADGSHVLTTRTTLAEYGETWIRAQHQQRPSTAEQMEARWRVHILPVLGEIPLADLTRPRVVAAVQQWIDGDEASGRKPLAPATIEVTYGYLASIMKSAVLDRLIRESPCRAVKLPPIVRERVIPLTTEQVHQIADSVTPRYRAMVYLGAATGMRSGELRGLTVDRLKMVGQQMRITIDRQLVTTEPKWGPPKTARSDRTIMIDEMTARMLAEHMLDYPPHESGLIFLGRTKGPLARTTMATVWIDAIGRAGLSLKDRSGWHELRHHHASLLISAGLSVVAVADRLGHKDSTETLKTYAHLWADDETRAALAIQGSLWRPVGVVSGTSQQPHSNRAILEIDA